MKQKRTLIVVLCIVIAGIAAVALLRNGTSDSRMFASKAQGVIESLRASNYQDAVKDFNTPLKEAANPQVLGQQWSRIIEKYGPLEEYSIIYAGATVNDPSDIYAVYIKCKFHGITKYLVTKFDRYKQINYLDIRDTPPTR